MFRLVWFTTRVDTEVGFFEVQEVHARRRLEPGCVGGLPLVPVFVSFPLPTLVRTLAKRMSSSCFRKLIPLLKLTSAMSVECDAKRRKFTVTVGKDAS